MNTRVGQSAAIAGAFLCVAMALGLGGRASAAGPDDASRINPYTWRAVDDEDLVAGLSQAKTEAERTCMLGLPTARFADPGAACLAAYDAAYAQRRFERALRYTAIGCQVHLSPANCRRLGALPLRMGNAGTHIPASFAPELKRIADFVCLSGARYVNFIGRDITGHECGYFARQFVLARDPEYARAVEPRVHEFYEGIYEPSRTARLLDTACRKLGYAGSCEDLREIAGRIDARDLAEGHETIDREAGDRLVDADVVAAGLAYEGALGAGRFEDALRYAVTGCEKHRDAHLCRQVAELPVRAGNRNVRASAAMIGEVQRMAEFVCLAGAPIRNAHGNEVTGVICAHFAAQFVLARDAEQIKAYTPGARRNLDALYRPAQAQRLMNAACGRSTDPKVCQLASLRP